MTTALPRPRRDWRGRIQRAMPAIILLIAILLFWEFFGAITGQPSYVVPALTEVIYVAVTRAGDKLLPAASVTAQEVILGFLLGGACGLLIGTAIFLSTTLRRALLPLVIASQAVPVIAIAPILIIWLGFGLAPIVVVAALVVFFPVAINSMAGLNSADRDMVTLMHSLGAGDWQIFWKLHVPAALPMIFTGLKNAAAISAIGAIVGEWVGASAGLGTVMIQANASFKTATTFAAILYLAAIAIALFAAVAALERLALPWQYIEKARR